MIFVMLEIYGNIREKNKDFFDLKYYEKMEMK